MTMTFLGHQLGITFYPGPMVDTSQHGAVLIESGHLHTCGETAGEDHAFPAAEDMLERYPPSRITLRVAWITVSVRAPGR